MRKLSILLCLLLAATCFGAIPATTVWEISDAGNIGNGGGFVWQSLVGATGFTWTKSGSGTDEYYCLKGAGACTGTQPLTVTCNGYYTTCNLGTVGSLTAGRHGWDDNDSLGFDTLYVRLANGLDPDVMWPGYVSMSTGVDWSQATSHDSVTDLAVTRGNNTQVYRTGATKFAADDANNIFQVTATTGGFTIGWYHAKSWDGNDLVLDRSPAAAGSATGVARLGGALALGNALVDNEFWSSGAAGTYGVIAGNTVFCAGDWALSEAMNATGNDATSPLPIVIIGYKTNRSDAIFGSDLPDWNIAAQAFQPGDYWVIRNIHMTGTGSYVVAVQAGGIIDNCIVTNTSAVGGRKAIYIAGKYANVAHCVVTSPSAVGISCEDTDTRISDCYIYTCASGVLPVTGTAILGCVLYNNTKAFDTTGTQLGMTVSGCTFAANATTFSGATSVGGLYRNNIIDNSATAEATWTSACLNLWRNNCWGEATPTLTNVSPGINDIFADPDLTDPAGGDFTVSLGSVAIGAGMQVGTNLGLVGDYPQNIGVDPNDYIVGSGGSSTTIVIAPNKNGGKQ
jgi:hypothetical protein